MRRFVLDRERDLTDVSGTGVIAEGVECEPDGLVLLYWKKYKTSGTYPSMQVIEEVHCHHALTVVRWIDEAIPV